MSKFTQRSDARYDAPARTWHYDVVALSVPIIFNRHRDHDPNGMLYALATHRPELQQLASKWHALAEGPRTVAELEEFTAHPLVRPLVLRARAGDVMVVRFTNHLPQRHVGMHLVAPGTDVSSDGSAVGNNASSLAAPGETVVYTWRCHHEGSFVFHDIGDPDGDETGTNAHGLFGALIVEPRHAWWTDPTQDGLVPVADGLYVDVHQRSEMALRDPEDQGQKAFNYRSERIDAAFVDDVPLANPLFRFPLPATPIVDVPARAEVVLRLVCAADKPRNHGFTLHGHAWREWPHRGAESPVMSSEGALSSSSVRSYHFRANEEPGDYLYRSSVFKWAVAQGAWGILRVH